MWVASTLPSTGVLVVRTTGHADEEEALIAALDRCTKPRDKYAVYEIPDHPVLPGWSRREDAAA